MKNRAQHIVYYNAQTTTRKEIKKAIKPLKTKGTKWAFLPVQDGPTRVETLYVG